MAPRKVLVTGSNGFIGGELVQYFLESSSLIVFGISKGECRTKSDPRFHYQNIDISQGKEVILIVNQIQPDVIVHCAAISQVDECEKHPEKCHAVNVLGTKNLVETARRIGAKFIFLSSDFVFDGKEKWNSNNIQPNPISVYGKSKLKAEKVVATGSLNYAIIRPVLVYGFSPFARRRNFFYWVFKSLKNGVSINVVNDQMRTPTHVDDLVKLIGITINNNVSGVYNIGGSTRLSVHDFAIQIAEISGEPKGLIKEGNSKSVINANLRPLNSCFNNFDIISEFEFIPLSIPKGIERALEKVYQSQILE